MLISYPLKKVSRSSSCLKSLYRRTNSYTWRWRSACPWSPLLPRCREWWSLGHTSLWSSDAEHEKSNKVPAKGIVGRDLDFAKCGMFKEVQVRPVFDLHRKEQKCLATNFIHWGSERSWFYPRLSNRKLILCDQLFEVSN